MTAPETVTCPWCHESLPNDPGAYYHQKSCQRRDVERRIAEHVASEKPDPRALTQLRGEHELASFVGD